MDDYSPWRGELVATGGLDWGSAVVWLVVATHQPKGLRRVGWEKGTGGGVMDQ